jgi:hypothetical protein
VGFGTGQRHEKQQQRGMETEQRHGFVFLSDRTQLDFSATGAKLDFSALNADDEGGAAPEPRHATTTMPLSVATSAHGAPPLMRRAMHDVFNATSRVASTSLQQQASCLRRLIQSTASAAAASTTGGCALRQPPLQLQAGRPPLPPVLKRCSIKWHV